MIPEIGQPLDRVDGRAKVTGSARYAIEQDLPRLVHAVVVFATIPSGTIRSIETAAAKRAPGVLAILTHLNAPKLNFSSIPTQPPAQGASGTSTSTTSGPAQQSGSPSGNPATAGSKPAAPAPANPTNFPEPRAIPLSDARVHYVGQQIAVVVAETLEQATYAAQLVKVSYDLESPRLDLQVLRGEGIVKANPMAKPFAKGDADSALASAAVNVDQVYRTPFEHHNPIEAHAIVASWDGNHLTLHDSTQNMFASRQTLASAFGIPKENVHVLSPFVGGAFGSKGSMWPHVLMGVMAAREVMRPVKLWLPRKQLFYTNGHRPETEQRVALGASADGKLVSIIHEGVCQGNTISDYSERFDQPARVIYASPNLRGITKVVNLNISTPTYMRAPGENPGMFAIESAMDELAFALKLDPIQLRLINHADADPLDDKPWSSKSLKQCYARGSERFGWSARNPEPRSMREGRLLIGQGMASATYPSHRAPASAKARISSDGNVLVSSGSHEMGMGTATVMAQVAAETLGVPFERVRFAYGDTDLPVTPISAGSMTVSSVGSAVFEAVTALRRKLLELAAGDDGSPLHCATFDEVVSRDGKLVFSSDANRSESYTTLLSRHYLPFVEAQVDAVPDPDAAKYSSHAFGAHFAEVSVDPELGMVRLRRVVSAFAAGRILNAKTARSQYLGGIVQGIGMALLEKSHFDKRIGSFTTVNLAEYLVPVNADIRSIEVILVEESDAHVNPIGAKGIGEVGIVGVAPAIANAVFHATGKRIRELPITLDKLVCQ